MRLVDGKLVLWARIEHLLQRAHAIFHHHIGAQKSRKKSYMHRQCKKHKENKTSVRTLQTQRAKCTQDISSSSLRCKPLQLARWYSCDEGASALEFPWPKKGEQRVTDSPSRPASLQTLLTAPRSARRLESSAVSSYSKSLPLVGTGSPHPTFP